MRAPRKKLLIVDGYNVINSWRSGMDARTLADAREELAHKLMDYAGYTGQKVVLVFDAWMSDRKTRTTEESGPLIVVYTQKGETADHYIERLCDSHAKDVEYDRLEIDVATSDNVEQVVVLSRGARRISSRELLREMEAVRTEGAETVRKQVVRSKSTVMDSLPEDIRMKLDRMRRGQ